MNSLHIFRFLRTASIHCKENSSRAPKANTIHLFGKFLVVWTWANFQYLSREVGRKPCLRSWHNEVKDRWLFETKDLEHREPVGLGLPIYSNREPVQFSWPEL